MYEVECELPAVGLVVPLDFDLVHLYNWVSFFEDFLAIFINKIDQLLLKQSFFIVAA